MKMKEYDLNGVIIPNDDAWIYDWVGLDNISPSKVRGYLDEAAGDSVVFNINSGGGDLYSGVNIHDMLCAYPGDIEIHVSGIAASAASIIAMACKCFMTPASVMMIHNTACEDYGNKKDKIKTSVDLGVHDKAIASLYAQKTGKDISEIARMMDKETYLDAQTALENGFIDGILTESTPKIINLIGTQSKLIPDNVITELRNLKIKNSSRPDHGVPVEQLQKRLNLLRR